MPPQRGIVHDSTRALPSAATLAGLVHAATVNPCGGRLRPTAAALAAAPSLPQWVGGDCR